MQLFKKNEGQSSDLMRSIDNSAKTLLANIRFMSVDNPVRTVVITSAIPNEGKTFVAANLATAMATSGMRTLLVESDMRRRSMSSMLKAHAQHGVYSVLAGEVSLEDAVVPTDTKRLFFLDAEPHIPNPSDLLNSRRFTDLINKAKAAFDYVVFDTPPVGTFVDAAVLGAKVDAVFMVVREGYTRKDDIARAADQLKAANVPLNGIVMNFCERNSNNYYYYYYEYYYREGNDGKRRRRRRRRRKDENAPQLNLQADLHGEQAGGLIDIPTRTAQQSQVEVPEQVAAPTSWDNAPDLDAIDAQEQEPAHAAPTTTQEAPRDRNSLYSAIPSIGNTGLMSRDELDKRLRAEEQPLDETRVARSNASAPQRSSNDQNPYL